MAFWAAAAPALIGAAGSLLGGLLGDRSQRKQQRQNFENQLKLLREQTRLSQVGLSNPWRTVNWEGPLNNRRQVVTLNPRDQEALDQHRAYRSLVMANWNPRGGWFDDERSEPAAPAPAVGQQEPGSLAALMGGRADAGRGDADLARVLAAARMARMR
ncbi:MAG: hypothetical protein OXH38_11890 [Chloroflexi bacterium]|nr:hypothetical protein [Chloroflexota bacterium]